MPQAKSLTVDEIRELQVSAALDEAVKISEETTALLGRRKANREELRGLVAGGFVKDSEDVTMIEELYPTRSTERKTEEERAAELDRQAEALRKRAADKAQKAS